MCGSILSYATRIWILGCCLELERFVVALDNRACAAVRTNAVRMLLLSWKGQPIENIPTSSAVLL